MASDARTEEIAKQVPEHVGAWGTGPREVRGKYATSFATTEGPPRAGIASSYPSTRLSGANYLCDKIKKPPSNKCWWRVCV